MRAPDLEALSNQHAQQIEHRIRLQTWLRPMWLVLRQQRHGNRISQARLYSYIKQTAPTDSTSEMVHIMAKYIEDSYQRAFPGSQAINVEDLCSCIERLERGLEHSLA